MTIYDDISKRIIGRVAITKVEADYLEKLLAACGGLHVEIGTLWGGTAILAALAKPAGNVITIDYMKLGYWETGDPDAPNETLSEGVILKNLETFGAGSRIECVKADSYPWPLDKSLIPETVFIDAGHAQDEVFRDFLSVKDVTEKYIIFHDYGRLDGVTKAVDSIHDKGWKLTEVFQTLAVLERVPVKQPAEQPAQKVSKKRK